MDSDNKVSFKDFPSATVDLFIEEKHSALNCIFQVKYCGANAARICNRFKWKNKNIKFERFFNNTVNAKLFAWPKGIKFQAEKPEASNVRNWLITNSGPLVIMFDQLTRLVGFDM